jgi:hypothetical protein
VLLADCLALPHCDKCTVKSSLVIAGMIVHPQPGVYTIDWIAIFHRIRMPSGAKYVSTSPDGSASRGQQILSHPKRLKLKMRWMLCLTFRLNLHRFWIHQILDPSLQ